MLSIIGKLLVDMLSERLTKFVDRHNILCENQAGFRKGYRTTDRIFTLHSVIDHMMNTRKNLYLCVL